MNTPKWTHISISPSIFPPTCAYTFTTLHFLHTLFRNPKTPPHHHSSLLKYFKKKRRKKRKRRKVKRKREIWSYKKENKWEHLLPSSLPSTLSIIIHLTWEYNHHKWYLLCFYNPLCFISIFAFSQVISLEIVSFYFLQPPHMIHPKIGILLNCTLLRRKASWGEF